MVDLGTAQVEVVLAQPRGFCAGVERAVLILGAVVDKYSAYKPVYVLHEIVHNAHVVESFRKKNVTFVNSLRDVPQGAVLVFSAHGVAKHIRSEAQDLGLLLVDATCPLVTKVHLEICRYYKYGYQVILIGHKGHREVEGSLGQVPCNVLLVQSAADVNSLEVEDDTKLAYVTQTTLSVDDTRVIIDRLKEKFPNIVGPDLKDICYATQNRQNAVKQLASMVDVVLVVGGTNSSNTKRLLELAQARNTLSFLVESHEEVDFNWFEGVRKIGITAGASAPDDVVQKLLKHLGSKMAMRVSTMDGIRENVVFKLPELQDL